MTRAPRRNRLSIERATDSSLPGTGLALKMTVSFGWILTSGWSPRAMRLRTLVGSPWLPVDDAAVGHVEEAELARHAQVLFHAATDDGRGAAELVGRAHDFAQAADVRGEGRHQDA